jgi:glycosyltransferase involved in cell wall biosynthesis
MIRVAFSYDIFERQRFGGISRYFVELANSLLEEKLCTVEFATLLHINSHLTKSQFKRGIYLPFSPERLRLSKFISKINSHYSAKTTSKKCFQIRHETFYNGGILKVEGQRTVTTVYDLIREKFEPNWRGYSLKSAALERADEIVAISESTAYDLMKFYNIPSRKVNIIPLAINDTFFNLNFDFSKKHELRQLLYVGGRGGYKDFLTLGEAFARSNYLQANFQVLVFGPRFTPEERCFLTEKGILHSFRHLSGDDVDLVNAYRDSLALIITSKYEGFGLTALEAMAGGCQVITNGGGSLSEVCKNYAVYFEPSNYRSLEEAIKTLESSSHQRQIALQRAQNYAKTFTWSQTAQMTFNVYQKLI